MHKRLMPSSAIQKTMESKQELFLTINLHLLQDEKPSDYMNQISDEALFMEYPFTMLLKLKATEQSPKHHPEGNVWNHTMLVTDMAAQVKEKSMNPKVFMWAALLHDIGKPDTTKRRNGRITSYDHDKLGAELAQRFLKEFSDDLEFIKAVSGLVRWHMQILFVINSLPFADITKMKEQVSLDEIALLGFCDRMGRTGADKQKEIENTQKFLQKCSKYK